MVRSQRPINIIYCTGIGLHILAGRTLLRMLVTVQRRLNIFSQLGKRWWCCRCPRTPRLRNPTCGQRATATSTYTHKTHNAKWARINGHRRQAKHVHLRPGCNCVETARICPGEFIVVRSISFDGVATTLKCTWDGIWSPTMSWNQLWLWYISDDAMGLNMAW